MRRFLLFAAAVLAVEIAYDILAARRVEDQDLAVFEDEVVAVICPACGSRQVANVSDPPRGRYGWSCDVCACFFGTYPETRIFERGLV